MLLTKFRMSLHTTETLRNVTIIDNDPRDLDYLNVKNQDSVAGIPFHTAQGPGWLRHCVLVYWFNQFVEASLAHSHQFLDKCIFQLAWIGWPDGSLLNCPAHRCRASRACSIGFRSGENAGHGNWSVSFCSKNCWACMMSRCIVILVKTVSAEVSPYARGTTCVSRRRT